MEAEKQPKNSPKKSFGTPFPKGVSGNPKGRPKGKTIKEMVRDWLDEHPDDMASFIKHFIKENRDLAWRMLEGNPAQSNDLTSGGKPIQITFDNAFNPNKEQPNKD